ncbi:MAG: alpha/beta fold hydrolase [Solirubrobacteraceae bacterium]|nr:alpha/beta fold hydrolase [Solirubrobacteraceae bacterium]
MPTILHTPTLAADDATRSADDLTPAIPVPEQQTPAKAVAGSLLAGLACSVALVAGPFAGSGEATTTGAILVGFAIGWALPATLSIRRDAGSHRWAAVPAAALGTTGVALIGLAPGTDTLDTLAWVWPPAILALTAWMTAQVARQPRPRRGSRVLYPVLALMALTTVGGGYETIAASTSGGAVRVAGDRLIDVGGHRLNIRCTGAGSPVVILEPGLGEPTREMAKLIAPQVARTTRICVYDRAGHGRSDVAPKADAARDLHELLRRAHVRGPVVLAGHSLGGMFALSYADRYPAEVGGVALIDSMHPEQTHAAAGMGRALAPVPTVARTGIARLLLDPDDGPPVEQARQLARDVQQMPAELNRAARLETLGDRPLGVVTAGTGSKPGWAKDQNDLATLSSRSFHRTVPGSTHGSLILDPAHAQASSRAIEDVVRQVRSER